MLAGRSQRATRHRGYPFLLKRRNGILVRERALTCDAGVEWYMDMLMIRSSIVFPIRILRYLFIAHGGITCPSSIANIWSQLKEER